MLFGGGRDFADPVFTDTWEWDGHAWTRVATSGPSGSIFLKMSYDARRRRVVAFGGRGGGGETWEWDGRAWSRVSTSGPPPRDHHAMTYDARRQRIVDLRRRTPAPERRLSSRHHRRVAARPVGVGRSTVDAARGERSSLARRITRSHLRRRARSPDPVRRREPLGNVGVGRPRVGPGPRDSGPAPREAVVSPHSGIHRQSGSAVSSAASIRRACDPRQ